MSNWKAAGVKLVAERLQMLKQWHTYSHIRTCRAYLKNSKSLDYEQRYHIASDALLDVFALSDLE